MVTFTFDKLLRSIPIEIPSQMESQIQLVTLLDGLKRRVHSRKENLSVGNGGFDELMITPRVEVISDLPAPDAGSHWRVRYGQHAISCRVTESLAVVAEVSDNSIITLGVKGS